MVSAVEDGGEGGGDLVCRDGDEGLFVTRNAELEERDAVAVEERGVCFRYSSRMRVSTERRPSVRRKGKCFFLGKEER